MIRFSCSNCGRVISVDDKHSGRKGKCPKCGGVVVVPEKSTIIQFQCNSCGHKIKVPGKYGGKRGKCPKCHEPVVIPSPIKKTAVTEEKTRIECQMCGQVTEVSTHGSEGFIECPSCGGFVETSPNSIPTAPTDSGDSLRSTAEDEPSEEVPHESGEQEGVDRRLIVIISAVAGILVVGLVIIVSILQLSRPKPKQQMQQEVVDIAENQAETEFEDAKAFTEQYISLLEKGEVDEAFKLHSPELAKDTYKRSFERLSKQIGSNRIIEMNCTRTQREPHDDEQRISLWYDLSCEEGMQNVNVSVLLIGQDFKIDRITARDNRGRAFSIGLSDSGIPSQSGRVVRHGRVRSSPGKFFFATLVGFAIGTLFSAGCLWIGMKVTDVEGTFAAMIGIAAISSLATLVPVFIGLMPCVGWLMGLIVMFILISKWTDAEFWPDAVGMVLISGVVGILARVLLGFLISMA